MPFGAHLAAARSLRWVALLVVGVALLTGCITEEEEFHGPRIGTNSQRVTAQIGLARGYLQLDKRDLNAARAALERALAIDPNAWEAHDLMATLHWFEGENALAEQSWLAAIRHGGGARARRNFATFLMRSKRFQDACAQLKSASADVAYESRAQVFEDLGKCEGELGDSSAAFAAYNRAIELNAQQPDAQLALAELLYGQGNYPQALAAYQQFRSQKPQSARSLWLGIRLGRAMQDADAEASHALMLRNQFPDSPEYKKYQESRP